MRLDTGPCAPSYPRPGPVDLHQTRWNYDDGADHISPLWPCVFALLRGRNFALHLFLPSAASLAPLLRVRNTYLFQIFPSTRSRSIFDLVTVSAPGKHRPHRATRALITTYPLDTTPQVSPSSANRPTHHHAIAPSPSPHQVQIRLRLIQSLYL